MLHLIEYSGTSRLQPVFATFPNAEKSSVMAFGLLSTSDLTWAPYLKAQYDAYRAYGEVAYDV